jgi:hypothetical protein
LGGQKWARVAAGVAFWAGKGSIRIDNLEISSSANTETVVKDSIVFSEAAGTVGGWAASFAENGAGRTNCDSSIVETGQTVAVVIEISSGIVRAGSTDICIGAVCTFVGASVAETNILIVSSETGTNVVSVEGSSRNAAAADCVGSGSTGLAKLGETWEALSLVGVGSQNWVESSLALALSSDWVVD